MIFIPFYCILHVICTQLTTKITKKAIHLQLVKTLFHFQTSPIEKFQSGSGLVKLFQFNFLTHSLQNEISIRIQFSSKRRTFFPISSIFRENYISSNFEMTFCGRKLKLFAKNFVISLSDWTSSWVHALRLPTCEKIFEKNDVNENIWRRMKTLKCVVFLCQSIDFMICWFSIFT